MPDMMEQIAEGQLLVLKSWLNENVHARGARLTAAQLVQEVTGEALSAQYFIDYLHAKFDLLYDLD